MRKFLLFFALLCFAFANCKAEKYALIVAIGDYPDPAKNGWPKISSDHDVTLVYGALKSQGFKPENIAVVEDSMATKKGIEHAFDQLTNRVHAGDVVVIHFSSHGEQIEDDNGDEIDGLDECIVPYGAVYSYDKQKFKEYAPGYFRDDEFGQEVTLLRNKLTHRGDLLVLIDACHSGTGTRGVSELQPRGAKDPMVSDDFDMNKINVPDTHGEFKDDDSKQLSSDAATYVVISGAQAKEFNYECYDDNGIPAGSLSYAFSKSISQLKDNTTYRGLFAQIQNIMMDKAPRQKPVLEGDGIDRTLFGGRFISQQPYYTIKQWNSDDEFVLNGGSIAGLTDGSTVSLFPAGTSDPAGKKDLTRGKITKVTNFNATVQLEKPDTVLYKKITWAFVTELNYGAKLKLDVRDVNGMRNELMKALKGFPLVEFDKNCDIYLDTIGNTSTWALKYPTTASVFEKGIKIDPNKLTSLEDALKRYARFRYLQGLDFNEEGLSAKVNLVFLKPDKTIDYAKLNSRIHNGRLELQEGDEVYLQVINTGEKSFFINIVDIQPDGKINPILPNKEQGIRPEDCEIAKYDSIILKSYKISIAPPFGQETFKVFLSKDKLDLEDILVKNDDSGSRSRGVLNNMAQVFKDADENAIASRGGTGTAINTDQNGTIYNLNFSIVNKK